MISPIPQEYSPATANDMATLQAQLGRPARGVLGIAARCVCSRPLVVATSPTLPDGTPFPTFFYLTHPHLVKVVSTLESTGHMEEMNADLQTDPVLAASYHQAHQHYLACREVFGCPPALYNVSAGGMPTRVKCLHALVGHALAAGPGVNPLGDRALQLLTEQGLWEPARCYCGDVLVE